MSFKATDGKSFGNRQKMNAYNSRSTRSLRPEQPEEQAQPEEGAPGEGQDLESVMAQHGPAQKVEISHEGGKHHMTSHHGGHKHHSEHQSAEEAHMEGAKAAGVEAPEEQAMPSYGQEDVGVM